MFPAFAFAITDVTQNMVLIQAAQQQTNRLCIDVKAGRQRLTLDEALQLNFDLQWAAIDTAHAQALLRLFPAANEATAHPAQA